jgi:hypothetical protein
MALARYLRVRRRLLGRGPAPFWRRPEPEAVAELAPPFMELVRRHRLEDLVPFLRIPTSGQGYGRLETIPAFYVLLWNEPGLLLGYVRDRLGLGPSVVKLLDTGTQTLFQEIARRDALDVVLGAQVRAVRRLHGAPVELSVCRDGELCRLEFDQVVVAADCRAALGYLTPATPEEQRIFGRLTSLTLVATLFEATRGPPQGLVWYVMEALRPEGGRTVSLVRDIRTSFPNARTGAGCAGVAYQLLDGPADQQELIELRVRFASEMVELGFFDVRVVRRQAWVYLPHFRTDAVAEGLPWAIAEMQGGERTWYTGSSVCFESMNNVMQHNLALVERFAER